MPRRHEADVRSARDPRSAVARRSDADPADAPPRDARSDDARPDLERVSRRDFEEVWHARDPSVVPDLYHDHYRGHGFPVVGTVSRSDYRRVARLFLGAFPDIRFDIRRLESTGAVVETDWTFEATHGGWIGPLPPSGATVSVDGWGRHRYEGDRVAETWLDLDWTGLASQLGGGYVEGVREAVSALV